MNAREEKASEKGSKYQLVNGGYILDPGELELLPAHWRLEKTEGCFPCPGKESYKILRKKQEVLTSDLGRQGPN